MVDLSNLSNYYGLLLTIGAAVLYSSISYGLSGENNHIEILKERAIIYKGYEDVFDIFENLSKYIKYDNYDLRWQYSVRHGGLSLVTMSEPGRKHQLWRNGYS